MDLEAPAALEALVIIVLQQEFAFQIVQQDPSLEFRNQNHHRKSISQNLRVLSQSLPLIQQLKKLH